MILTINCMSATCKNNLWWMNSEGYNISEGQIVIKTEIILNLNHFGLFTLHNESYKNSNYSKRLWTHYYIYSHNIGYVGT